MSMPSMFLPPWQPTGDIVPIRFPFALVSTRPTTCLLRSSITISERVDNSGHGRAVLNIFYFDMAKTR